MIVKPEFPSWRLFFLRCQSIGYLKILWQVGTHFHVFWDHFTTQAFLAQVKLVIMAIFMFCITFIVIFWWMVIPSFLNNVLTIFEHFHRYSFEMIFHFMSVCFRIFFCHCQTGDPLNHLNRIVFKFLLLVFVVLHLKKQRKKGVRGIWNKHPRLNKATYNLFNVIIINMSFRP